MEVKFATVEDIPTIQNITDAVWPQTYADILSPNQISYMMDRMYCKAALVQQMKEWHHVFVILNDDGNDIGFASYSIQDDKMILHKIYVLAVTQGKGIGRFFIEWLADKAKASNCNAIQLNVNIHNTALAFYQKMQFNIVRKEDNDIGNGYFMNDYVMERKL